MYVVNVPLSFSSCPKGYQILHFASSLVLLLLDGLLCEVVLPLASLLVLLVLDGNLAEVSDDVLHHGVGLAPLLAAEVVQTAHVGHDVVHNSDDDNHSDGVAPHNHDGDNVRAAVAVEHLGEGRGVRDLTSTTGEPTEDGEERGQDIDTEDGEDELEGGVGLKATGNEDEPVLSERDLKE